MTKSISIDLRSQAAERWASTVAGASKAVTVASWAERKSEEERRNRRIGSEVVGDETRVKTSLYAAVSKEGAEVARVGGTPGWSEARRANSACRGVRTPVT